MLTAVSRDQRWPDVVAGISARFSKFAFVLFCYCWFSHDVTKIQTAELLILLRFYFHDVLEQLKTNRHTNVHSEWNLGLVIDYA